MRQLQFAILLLTFYSFLSCTKTVDYGGCPQNGVYYSEIVNQTDEEVEVKIYHLINDRNHVLLVLDPDERQTIDYDITSCDSLVVSSTKNKSSVVLYGSRQGNEDPQIGLMCDWHLDEQKGWLSLPITASLISSGE